MSEPHPAFPSAEPPLSSRNHVPLLNSSDISNLLSQTKPLIGVKQKIIPAFERLVVSPNRDAAEEALIQPKYVLEERTDEELAIATVPLFYVLTARLDVANRNRRRDDQLLDVCARFVNVMDEQHLPSISARVSLFSWGYLQLAQGCERLGEFMSILYRLSMTSYRHCLTGSHAAFLEGCLITRSYEQALPCIREIYTDVKTGGCGYLDIIIFYHHAGLIAAATQDYPLAVELFAIVVQVPTHTASAIQVSAAKRAILCELLVTGKRLHLPKATSQVVARAVEKNHGVYFKLAKAFEGRDWDAVEKIAEDESKEYEKDCNLGLVHQVVGAVLERKIRKIKTLYSRLTIDQLVAKVATSRPKTTEEVLTKLQGMITSDKIQATISDSSPVIVTFSDDVAVAPEKTIDRLSSMTQMASLLQQHLNQSNRDIGMNPKYLQKQGNMLDIAGGGKGQGFMGDDFDPQPWGRAPLASVDHLMME